MTEDGVAWTWVGTDLNDPKYPWVTGGPVRGQTCLSQRDEEASAGTEMVALVGTERAAVSEKHRHLIGRATGGPAIGPPLEIQIGVLGPETQIGVSEEEIQTGVLEEEIQIGVGLNEMVDSDREGMTGMGDSREEAEMTLLQKDVSFAIKWVKHFCLLLGTVFCELHNY